jgi:aldehyde dehydrogenase (NAD+)
MLESASYPGRVSGRMLPGDLIDGKENRDNSVATAREEVFGPVATVIRADGEDHAVVVADDTDHGASASRPA